MARVEMVMDCRCATGESPVAYESGELLFVDIEGCTIHHFDAVANRQRRQVRTGGRMVGNVVACASPALPRADLLACLETSIVPVSFDEDVCKGEHIAAVPDAHLDPSRPHRFNDGKVDPQGRLWAGTMPMDINENPDAPATGRLYCLQRATPANTNLCATYELVEKLDSVAISNGTEWYGDRMYYVDSLQPEVSVFDFDGTDGAISNRRRVVHLPRTRGVPDGMTVDAAGKLWVAMCLGGAIVQIDPETQTELLSIEMPVLCPTSLAFAGKDLSDLYVTSSAGVEESNGGKSPHAGGLFRVRIPGVKGLSFSRPFTM